MTDPQIEFEDIESPSLRQQAKDLMEDIIQLSPSDAAVIATFKHLHDRFLAEVKIASCTVYMQVADQATVLGDLLEGVRAKLLTQIVDWRNHRFAS